MNAPEIVVEAPAPNLDADRYKETILRAMDELDKKKEELKTARDVMNHAYQKDGEYTDGKKMERDGRKKKLARQMTVDSENPTMATKLEDLSEDVKELKDAISDYLGEFYRLTGQTELERPDGTKYHIVRKCRAVPAGQMKLL